MQEGDSEQTDEQQQQAEQALADAQDAFEEERDRYMDLRQEELLFRMREELEQLLAKQKEATLQTVQAAEELAAGARLSRPLRRRLNEVGEAERGLGAKCSVLSEALAKESELVYSRASPPCAAISTMSPAACPAPAPIRATTPPRCSARSRIASAT